MLTPGKGWRPCATDEPEAQEDLNCLRFFQVNGFDRLYKKDEKVQ